MNKSSEYRALNKMSSIESIVVSTVAELTNHSEIETMQAFKKSKTREMLFNMNNNFYTNDIGIIRDKFLNECKSTLGW